jgi:hypothetical protein
MSVIFIQYGSGFLLSWACTKKRIPRDAGPGRNMAAAFSGPDMAIARPLIYRNNKSTPYAGGHVKTTLLHVIGAPSAVFDLDQKRPEL